METSPGEDRPMERLPRAFRLKRKRLIRPLFDRRRSDVRTVARGCVRLLFRTVPRDDAGVPIQVGFAAGRGGSAVRRNRIKRVLREVYRVRQQALVDLFSGTDRMLTLMVLYRGRIDGDESCIRRDLPAALRALADEANESSMSAEQP